ncbi:putative nuclease HARBI1 [Merluccius polli]|uniref:Nuclease HARBI1 n=1 Tax=Merluccius polli TaxID=89951 RepID=A0AA47N2J6_MERPO|nr:putative nuclease HARBI1 [Merluccius polli]
MPGVVGAIDGTHIQIIAPSKDEDVFVNRNESRLHSTNTQIVFDATFNILDVVAKWPGSNHDPHTLMGSGLRQLFERHLVPVGCHLLITRITLSPMRKKHRRLALCHLLFVESIFIIVYCFPPYMLGHTKIHEILWREDVITVITVCAILHNRLSGFLWTINNYTGGSKPTSWHAGMPVWSVLLTGRTYK